MRQRLILVLLRAAITVLVAGISTSLLTPAAADAALLMHDTPSYSFGVRASDARVIGGGQEAPTRDLVVEVAGGAPATLTAGYIYDLRTYLVAPRGLAGLADSGSINPSSVRFSQDSIRRGFSDGNGTIDDLIAGLRSGSVDPGDVPAIRILERDGQIFTLDNRRLHAFQEAGVDIRYRLATATEIADEGWKFTTTNGGTSIRIRGG